MFFSSPGRIKVNHSCFTLHIKRLTKQRLHSFIAESIIHRSCCGLGCAEIDASVLWTDMRTRSGLVWSVLQLGNGPAWFNPMEEALPAQQPAPHPPDTLYRCMKLHSRISEGKFESNIDAFCSICYWDNKYKQRADCTKLEWSLQRARPKCPKFYSN